MDKIDLRKELKTLYQPSAKTVAEVDVPEFRFLMIDGQGDPNTSKAFAEAAEALFSVSYTAKFIVKKSAQGVDYAVMPLEGLWWAEDMNAFASGDKANWKWTLMVMQPEYATDEIIKAAIAEAGKKKSLPALSRLRLERFAEGRSAQIMHIGPFSEEKPNIEKVHAYINEVSSLRGKHHEIYLSDIRRASPDKWKTVIRQPMN